MSSTPSCRVSEETSQMMELGRVQEWGWVFSSRWDKWQELRYINYWKWPCLFNWVNGFSHKYNGKINSVTTLLSTWDSVVPDLSFKRVVFFLSVILRCVPPIVFFIIPALLLIENIFPLYEQIMFSKNPVWINLIHFNLNVMKRPTCLSWVFI